MELATADDERLHVLGDAAGLLSSAPAGAYPAMEARWLITCAWNRGVTHAKFARGREARDHMQLALRMAAHVEGMGSDMEQMQEAYETAMARLGGATPACGVLTSMPSSVEVLA